MTTVIHNFKPQPFVNVAKHERMVNPASLTEDQKQMLWLGIKTVNPELVTLLKTDTNIDALKTAFNATVQFSADDVSSYMNAGLKALEERKP